MSEAIKQALQEAQYAALESQASALVAAYRADPGSKQQTAWMDFVEACSADQTLLSAWLEQHPGSYLANLAMGLWLTQQARQLRGTQTADQVSGECWRQIQANYEQAEEHLKQAMQGLPVGIPLACLMQREQICGSRTAAERYFSQLLLEDPQWLPAWLCMQAIREPRWGGSPQDMDALLQLAEGTLESEQQKGCLAAQHWWWRGNYKLYWESDAAGGLEALEQCLSLAERPQDIAQAQKDRSYALQQLQRPEEALQALQAAAQADPKNTEHLFRIGILLDELGRLPEALPYVEKGAARSDEYAYWCRRFLGISWSEGTGGVMRNAPLALHWFAQAMALSEQAERQAEMARFSAHVHLQGEQNAAGEQLLRQASELGNAEASYELAKFYVERSDAAWHEEIVRLYKLASDQGQKAAAAELLNYLQHTGTTDTQVFQESLRKAAGLGDPQAVRRMARQCWDEQQPQQALLWLARGALCSADNGYALARGLAEGWFGPLDHPQAIEVLHQLLKCEFHSDAWLSLYVSAYEIGKQDWGEVKVFHKKLAELQKLQRAGSLELEPRILQEIRDLRSLVPGNWLSWRLKKMFSRLPKLQRQTEIANFWD